MRKHLAFHGLILVLAISFILPPSVSAYEQFSGSNNCIQCHDSFDGFGATLHDFHNGFVDSCTDCHGSVGDNPLVQKCAACHIPNPLWNAHNSAPTDLMGFSCSTCHTFVGNDDFSWGETKALFE